MPGTAGTSTIGSPVVAIVAGGLTAVFIAVVGFLWRLDAQTASWLAQPESGWPVTAPSTDQTTTWPTTTPAPVDSASTCVLPPDYQYVAGANGQMSTVIPASWTPETMASPGSHEAQEQGDSGLLVRYGGAAAQTPDVYAGIQAVAADFQVTRPGYVGLRLDSTTVNAFPAAYWEFQLDVDGLPRHIGAYYWRADGNEYFVYASGPDYRWSETANLLTVMLSCAKP